MSKLQSARQKIGQNGIVLCLILGFAINLIIETLARKYLGGFSFLIHSPIIFLYNSLIIAATLSISCLFKRRSFFMVIISTIWLAIGVANGVILLERMTPFTVKDLSSITDAATILTNYFNRFQLSIIAGVLILLVITIVILWIKLPRKNMTGKFKQSVAMVALVVAVTFGATWGLIKTNVLATFFGNLAYAYQDYGAPYCFVNTWLNTGIHKPAGYSETAMKNILAKANIKDGKEALEVKNTDIGKKSPNIIFLQLESFTDPQLFNKIKLSTDAIPNFRNLMANYSSGYLTVPACGAGTANTEFEVMTGLSVKFFGPGEYPFKSVLRNTPAESIALDLKNRGYSTHAIHNHRALFYNRNEVFKNIGYDTFTSLEYMSDVPKTPKNWAKDKILTNQIMEALNSTESRDYIYTISVQGHGKYPTEQLVKNPKVTVTDAPSQDLKWKYEYYVNQLYEMDQFVKELTDTLSKLEEPTILVMYGDHIPALDITADSYDKDLYQTPYVIWSNFDMEKQDKDQHAYELTADVCDRVGIHEGTVFKYQQNTDHNDKSFLEGLNLLAYDMLYGDRYIYGGNKNAVKATKMKMGVKTVKIDKVVNVGGRYYIKGQNFTEYSKVTLNGEPLSTIYLGPTLLGLQEEVDPDKAKEMKVSQIDKSNKEIISTTE